MTRDPPFSDPGVGAARREQNRSGVTEGRYTLGAAVASMCRTTAARRRSWADEGNRVSSRRSPWQLRRAALQAHLELADTPGDLTPDGEPRSAAKKAVHRAATSSAHS